MIRSLLLVLLFLPACTSITKSGRLTEYALGTATPYQAEIELGKSRLADWLRVLTPKKRAALERTPLVAVQTYVLAAGEVPRLARRIGGGRNVEAVGVMSSSSRDASSALVKFVIIYDSKNQQMLGEEGYLIVDDPGKSGLGSFGGYDAVYIGTGN
jgi:hypothetical protein